MCILLCYLAGREPGCRLPDAPLRDVATAVVRAADSHRLPAPILAAVLAHESGLRVRARGSLGEIGLGQLYRGTVATRGHDHLSDEDLESPARNVWLAARHLARVRDRCGGWAYNWLGAYSGRACGETGYAVRVITKLRRAYDRYPLPDVRDTADLTRSSTDTVSRARSTSSALRADTRALTASVAARATSGGASSAPATPSSPTSH